MTHKLQVFSNDPRGHIVCEFELTPEQVIALREQFVTDSDDPECVGPYELNDMLAFYIGAFQ